MAFKNPGKVAQERAEKLTSAVNSALAEYYKKAKIKPSQQFSVSVAKGEGGGARTPEQQAAYVLKGTSWTCNSSHMADGAKHILLKQGGHVTWNLLQAKADKDAYTVLTDAWDGAMKKQDLRNFTGGKHFLPASSDPLHMELPGSKLKDSDPRVIEALEIYAKATRLNGKAKNTAFETTKGSQYQKDWLANYDKKLAIEKQGKK